MRRVYIFIAAVAAAYLDSVIFARFNLGGIRPDALLALTASFAVLSGSVKGAAFGAVTGLIWDILFSKYLGLSAIGFMVTGAIGGLFYQKYYADNIVMPALAALTGAFIKECIMAVALRLSGGTFSFVFVAATYILPSIIMTAALCMPLHAVLKRALAGQIRAEHRSIRPKADIGGAK